MNETLQETLRQALPDMPAEDVHAVAAFAEFLGKKRQEAASHENVLSDEQHARILAEFDTVTALSMQQGSPVCNRDHDHYLYGAK